ncbi:MULTISPECIES: ABC transporter permease [Bacillus cereus group]|uniref:ABC transporter permease n=1 Tax=Bacillus wiedmannii TaxID=1890302 RepID=A0ABD6TUZ3_9BACI|nr:MULTISPECIES: ABC transporter permease [Bacillus cereus group]EEK65658.1 Sodium export permease protein [Bacillus wiedmannii]KAA0795283.1 ABC transporter permease [Bacillus sp. BB081]MCC2376402.1 ABC transporter permease [Bacillus wiedmannii]MCC2420507.1 ABC transporter permease [Bacillus wiedmannii]PEA79796.1 ABC transporter permease [Bacillus wiedmannii]
MRKFSHVFSFYFREAFLSKKSLIMSAILFLIVFGIFAFNHFTSSNDKNKDKDKIAVVTESSTYKIQKEELTKLLPSAKLTIGSKEDFNKLHKQVEEGELDGLFRVTEKNGVPEVTYMFNGFASETNSTIIASYLKGKYMAITVAKHNVSPEIAQQLQTEISVKQEAIKDRSASAGIAYFFIFALYMFIVAFGSTIAMNIASEKASRVMEVMIPKVKPLTMMYAKILAVVSTALLQLVILACGYLVPYLLGWVDLENGSLFGVIDVTKLDAKIIGMFLIYFVTGYFLYAMMYAAAGAVVSKTEDLQGVMLPISILIIAAFFISLKSLGDPNSTIVVISSYVPFFTPMVTFSRFVAGETGMLEIMITLAGLLATIGILSAVTSRIYVNGVMNYSDKVKFKDLAKFIKRQ